MRDQSLGTMVLTAIVPIWLLLEDRLGVFPYAVLLFGALIGGATLYLRGGGWDAKHSE
jgi:hypothetical protein